ncbi:MAG: uroporphyrinogen-III C-methyltransferase [Epsilonproteobacteria bacterium]|nr:uroporphyrinogen-III C-methyltransferase [Campylobacterota bacterium]
MKTLPILLKNQKILLIGGGKVALQKASVLQENEIDFRIVACEFIVEFESFTCQKVQKAFSVADIGDERIIIDATGNEAVAQMLVAHKKSRDILLNVVDVPHLCDFYFMALTKNRPLQIAVSSNGASPTAAKYFRDECERLIPKDITAWLEQKQRERDMGLIDAQKSLSEVRAMSAKVFLVGCGLGDVELLTIKAYKTITSVDVVLYDHLISDEIMAIVPATTEKIYVGKQKGCHSKSQEQINELIISHAKRGRRVARLKSGDPFVFGRGAEELEELVYEGIEAEVIAGISSSIAAPQCADIPVTARGYASGFSVVSAHLKNNRVNLEWVPLLGMKSHTVVVLMGLSRVNEIVAEAKRLGIDTKTPCAIVSNASRKNQKTVVTTLLELEKEGINIERPSILVFGDVVLYREKLAAISHAKYLAA